MASTTTFINLMDFTGKHANGESDISPLLDAIGQAVESRKVVHLELSGVKWTSEFMDHFSKKMAMRYGARAIKYLKISNIDKKANRPRLTDVKQIPSETLSREELQAAAVRSGSEEVEAGDITGLNIGLVTAALDQLSSEQEAAFQNGHTEDRSWTTEASANRDAEEVHIPSRKRPRGRTKKAH